MLTDKIAEFAVLVKKHNKKFWCNNWAMLEYTNEVHIRAEYDTKWYKFGKSGKTIKSFVLENKRPNEFKTIEYGIECPICYAVTTTKSETIDLSKEV